ncbi:DnaJ domain-containing protein [Xylaria telfairii]|nr:DnaJ domain-containing protein [Xylaria telfairii]
MAPVPITKDFYMILEVDQTATIEVISRAYKRLALKHHPDRNAHRDTTAAFQLLGEAYETLKDEIKRRAYDLIYPSIRRCHTTPQTSCPPPTSEPRSGISSEASQINNLEKAKQDRRAQWETRKKIFESSIFELQRDIRRFENEISALELITADEAAQEARDNGWGAWLLSPIYKRAQVSEEEKARKERQKQERRIQKDMKERRLYSKREDLKKQNTLLRTGEAEVDSADNVDNWKIRSLQTKIREREAQERQVREAREAREKAQREARERAQREEAARVRKREQEEQERALREKMMRIRKEEQEKQEKRQREAAEERKRQAAEAAAARRRQEEQASARFGYSFDDEGLRHFSATGACVHDGWWPKLQGRTACPKCHVTWNYLLKCPGCNMKACPKCQAEIRPRRTRRW